MTREREVSSLPGDAAITTPAASYEEQPRRGWSHAVTSRARVAASCQGVAAPASQATTPVPSQSALGVEPSLPLRQAKTNFSFMQQEGTALAGMFCIQSVGSALPPQGDGPTRALRRPCSMEARPVSLSELFSSGEHQARGEPWDDGYHSQYPLEHRWSRDRSATSSSCPISTAAASVSGAAAVHQQTACGLSPLGEVVEKSRQSKRKTSYRAGDSSTPTGTFPEGSPPASARAVKPPLPFKEYPTKQREPRTNLERAEASFTQEVPRPLSEESSQGYCSAPQRKDVPRRSESQPDRRSRWASPGRAKAQSARSGSSARVVGIREVSAGSKRPSIVGVREVQPTQQSRTPRPNAGSCNEAVGAARVSAVSVVGVREVQTAR
eukprot:gnl/MRDRNA2_/MRDRNA2_23051_c0_seq1.p1 gnl/MRDRNA2_/MRDRNA2_23051_c0~~gnl/MRDRNA2_/MRDRNA2_23051_c0_seq1.p1  ORF type:complete len:439 (+),score=67.61 gnl/MRDRNA2_/MRDRNA2_23051_c0_seq1:175-1317(+)